MSKLKFKRTLEGGYRKYTAEYEGIYLMVCGNVGENLDWGLYVNNEPKAEFPNLYYSTGLSFAEAKYLAELYAKTIGTENYLTEDGHIKRDCPKCEASEHVGILDYYGHCEICEMDQESYCEDCGDDFQRRDLRPWKYEPSDKLCDSCFDNRMREDEEAIYEC